MVFRSFSGIEKSPTAYNSRNDTHSFQGRWISGYINAIYYNNITILNPIERGIFLFLFLVFTSESLLDMSDINDTTVA